MPVALQSRPAAKASPQLQAHLDLHFHRRQADCYFLPATEILYGGAAGGGKSHFMRMAAILWCMEIPGLQVYLFRRVEDDLIKNHMEGPKGFRNMLAKMVASGFVKIVETEIRFSNGSKIFLCHCKDENHRFKYHGSEIHVLMFDELTTFTERIYRYLRFRVRMVGLKNNPNFPKKYLKGEIGPHGERNEMDWFPRIMCGSNPGNIGHHFVKRMFIDVDQPMKPKRMDDSEGGMVRAYVPARLEDNPSMIEDDPEYRNRMRGLGDPALVRAMELGDWNIVAGGYFTEWNRQTHVLRAQTPPKEIFTRLFRATDWGSSRPFSTGWYGIADEDWRADGSMGNTILVRRGSLVRYRELYGLKENQDNIGLKWPVEKWAGEVLRLTPEDEEKRMKYTVVDTSMFDEDGGPSLAERAEKVKKAEYHLNLRRADKRRLPGWDQMRFRLVGPDHEDIEPTLFLMDNQPHAIRTIESVQHDETKHEDLDTDQEDHAVDEIRYACMSRPLPIHRRPPRRIAKGPKPFTFDWVVQQGGAPVPAARRNTYQMED